MNAKRVVVLSMVLMVMTSMVLPAVADVETTKLCEISGGGIMGTSSNAADTGLNDTQRAEGFARLTDGNGGSRADTHGWYRSNDPLPKGYDVAGDDFVGLKFSTAQSGVAAIEIDAHIYSDGGWFESTPVVQITFSALISGYGERDGLYHDDNIWVTVSSSNNYPADATSANAGSVTAGSTYRFTLDTPKNNVRGIRIIGGSAGTIFDADSKFLAIQEVRCFVSRRELIGEALMGAVGNGTDNADTGILDVHHDNAIGELQDGTTSAEDTIYITSYTNVSDDFIGIRFSSAQDGVDVIEFDAQYYGDGGWMESTPIVQVTQNSAINGYTRFVNGSYAGGQQPNNDDDIWTTVSATTDYPTDVTDTSTGSLVIGDTYTFTLDTPQNGIYGIRIIGNPGGTVNWTEEDDDFFAVQEVRTYGVIPPKGTVIIIK